MVILKNIANLYVFLYLQAKMAMFSTLTDKISLLNTFWFYLWETFSFTYNE